MTRNITCIICPRGCGITVEYDEKTKEIFSVAGNSCPRGKTYVQNEIISPVRTLTTTVAKLGGGVIAVKTNKPVPKELLFECMKEVNKARVPDTAKAGDVVISDILGTGSDVIITG